MDQDEQYMEIAMEEARKAAAISEVPIGAVIVHEGTIIASGYNQRERCQTTLSHAELIAIKAANKHIGSWRLEACTLYVTLEPCPMCAGAIIQSRIPRVVFGAADLKSGCGGTLLDLFSVEEFNHQASVTSGVLAKECGEMITAFFQELRKRKK